MKADDRKVKLDDRFKAVLTDPRFQVSASGKDEESLHVPLISIVVGASWLCD